MNSNIMVSICCLVYNHEPYLRKALESMVKQKTNFKYEILIHDDASTDRSQEIIKEYEEKYPDLIKPIYQTENQKSKKIKVTSAYNYPRVKGKYIARLEGDDYYADEYKLQKQFDIMENHPECSFCSHKVLKVSEDGKKELGYYPNVQLNEGVCSANEIYKYYLKDVRYLFHMSSFFYRSEYLKELLQNKPDFLKSSPIGDDSLVLYLMSKGNAYYIDEILSVYRVGSKYSWINTQGNSEKRVLHCNGMIKMAKEFNEFSEGKYSDYINEYIKYQEFQIYLAQHRFNKLVSKEYRVLYKNVSLKRKCRDFLCFLFPFLDKIYLIIKR